MHGVHNIEVLWSSLLQEAKGCWAVSLPARQSRRTHPAVLQILDTQSCSSADTSDETKMKFSHIYVKAIH